MSRRRFENLSERLLSAGIAPRHVRRYVAELRDHFDDLMQEELADGASSSEAEARARTQLGSDETLAAAMLDRPELRSFASRYPLLIFGVGPAAVLACTLVLATLLEGGLLYLN
jgi:hypothetical protein